MRPNYEGHFAGAIASSALAEMTFATEPTANIEGGSPLFGVRIPKGYRHWELIAPALEATPLDELTTVLGNAVAIKAHEAGTLPFPDGTVFAELAWKQVQPPEFEPASVPGAATTVQVIVKDSKKFSTTGC